MAFVVLYQPAVYTVHTVHMYSLHSTHWTRMSISECVLLYSTTVGTVLVYNWVSPPSPVFFCPRSEEVPMEMAQMNVLRIARRRRRRNMMITVLAEMAVLTGEAVGGAVGELERVSQGGGHIRRGKVAGARFFRRGPSPWIDFYLGSDPTYPGNVFRQRFRVPRSLFYKLHTDLVNYDCNTWDTRRDCTGRDKIRSEIKVLVCLRLLGTGRSLDDLDDCAQMGRETIRYYFKRFCKDMLVIYGGQFLNRRPRPDELQKLQDDYNNEGFAGCVGAIDCCKIKWKNCPYSLKGQYHSLKDGHLATIQVEAWCDHDLYIWHWFAGRCGTNNDKTMVAMSPLFREILTGNYDFKLPTPYTIRPGATTRQLPYFLADGIYPNWPIFVKPIHAPTSEAESKLTKHQEAVRKDVERCFGVLQARFKVLRLESHWWDLQDIVATSETCVIIHNLLICMRKNGTLEVDSGEEGIDLLTEFDEGDEEEVPVQSTNTAGGTVTEEGAQSSEVEPDLEAAMAELDVVHSMMTSEEEYWTLREELVDGVSDSTD